MKKHYRKETNCANCGTELKGNFCYVCGQENLELKENFGHMLNHAVSDYFHFDHHFFNTLKPLLFKPGKLTNEYMAGKRVQYLHPVKMYIFISLVYFVVLFSNHHNIVNINTTNKAVTKEQMAKADTAIMKSPVLSMQQKKDIIAHTHSKAANSGKVNNRIHIFGSSGDDGKRDTTYALYLVTQQKLPEAERDGFIKRYCVKREYELNGNNTDIKQLIQDGVKHNAPKMMFLLLPIFAIILRITFWKNKKFYVEHLIYSFHFHCFLFLFLTVIMLLKMAVPGGWKSFDDSLDMFAFAAIAWYFYKSLREVYHRTPGRTIAKMIGISLSYTTIFGICMMALVVIVALFD